MRNATIRIGRRPRARQWWAGVGAVLLPLIVLPVARAAGETGASYQSPANGSCGANDRPEAATQIQGDVPKADQDSGRAESGYNCGLALVGYNDFGGKSSSDLAWSGNCAYIQGDGGLRVVDVRQPDHPVVTQVLDSAGGSENIHGVTANGRAILVAARAHVTGPAPQQVTVPVDVFDVHNCTSPRLLGTIQFPGDVTDAAGPVHNVELSPDATKVYGTIPLQQADISDLAHPETWTVRELQCGVVKQYSPTYQQPSPLCDVQAVAPVPDFVAGSPPQLSHEVAFNKSGTRMYIGGQQPQPGENYVRILDMTRTTPDGAPTLITSFPGSGHGMRRATIGGREYLLHSNETAPGIPQPAERRANGCLGDTQTPFAGAAQARLADVTGDKAPAKESTLELAINRQDPVSCAAAASSSVNSTIHYHEVDNPDRTTFAMLSMKNAGLRVFDVRDPALPSEVAYFNPGQFSVTKSDGTTSKVLDRARMHTYYDAPTGHIWLLSETGGFWVLELEPQVRAKLGLPPTSAEYPNGREPRPATVAPANAVRLQASGSQLYSCWFRGLP